MIIFCNRLFSPFISKQLPLHFMALGFHILRLSEPQTEVFGGKIIVSVLTTYTRFSLLLFPSNDSVTIIPIALKLHYLL